MAMSSLYWLMLYYTKKVTPYIHVMLMSFSSTWYMAVLITSYSGQQSLENIMVRGSNQASLHKHKHLKDVKDFILRQLEVDFLT